MKPCLVFLVAVALQLVLCACLPKGVSRHPGNHSTPVLANNRTAKQLELFHWLFGIGKSSTAPEDLSATKDGTIEPVIVGPFQINGIKNSTLKRVSLTPAFEKGLRDEIYKFSLEQDLSKRSDQPAYSATSEKSRKKRSSGRDGSVSVKAKRSTTSHESGSQQQLLLKRQGLLFPQAQQYLLQQQAAYQQQLLALQNNQNQRLRGYNRRPYNGYNNGYLSDYDDSDSDEYDDFDSDEFMSFPVRAGYIPQGVPGFRGRK